MENHCYFLSGSWSQSPVSTHFRALADELASRGNQVVYLVDKQNHQVEDHAGNPAIYTWPSPRPTRLRDALFLRRLIKQYQPDCLVGAFGSANVMLAVGWWMRVPCRAAWYLTVSEALAHDGQKSTWRRKLLSLRKSLFYSLATHVLPNSFAGSKDVQRVHGVPDDKCKVLYLSLPDPKAELPNLDITEKDDRTICVGRFHPTKGQDVLLKAVQRLKDQFPDTIFEFVGDGPQRAECERLAQELGILDRCRFVGRVSHDEVLRRMASSAVSVVPSRSECFGLVNIESLATGTPVVASDVGGIGEIFDDGQEGYLVPPDDPATLADRLATILGDEQLRDHMSQKALERFQMFEQNQVIGDQVDWIESVTAEHDAQRTEAPAP